MGLWLVAAAALAAGPQAGTLDRVVDGDTLDVMIDGKKFRVQLMELDSPERGQRFFQEASTSLRELTSGRPLAITLGGKDRYKRYHSTVMVDGKDVALEQIRLGMGWVFEEHRRDEALMGLERDAREKRLGLWADEKPIAPWDFRRGVR